jgi:hypothetical protein
MDSRQLVSDRHVLQANCVDQEADLTLRKQWTITQSPLYRLRSHEADVCGLNSSALE